MAIKGDNSKPNEGFERAAVEGPDREQLEAEFARAVQPQGLPTTIRSGPHAVQTTTTVVRPSVNDVLVFGDRGALTCGSCKYFDLENGRKEIVRQRFGEKVVKDYEWKLRHLGADVDAIGLCGASGGEMATSFVSKACDQYRAKKV